MRLSLLTPYRDRPQHLQTQLAWWQQCSPTLRQALDWIIIEVTPEPSSELQEMLQQQQVRYYHLPCAGAFHKTKALNLGLEQATGELIAAFDVDLIPLGKTLERHLWLAERSPSLLVTGYRLMAATETVDLHNLNDAIAQASLGPEDQPTALRKHLLSGERFGVMPLFWRQRLEAINGWDETFVGWGAEDQDLMERYLLTEVGLCRCHELTYLHLQHGPAKDWNMPGLTKANREYYYELKRQREASARAD